MRGFRNINTAQFLNSMHEVEYMALYEFEGTRPEIGKTSFAPESTDIIGDVVIGVGAILDGKMAVGVPAKIAD